MKIKNITLEPSFTSRGDATISATVYVDGGYASVTAPAGASTGENEALHLPRGGAQAAISSFKKDKLIGIDAADLKLVSDTLKDIDGTRNFSSIGAAVAFSVSIGAVAAEANATSRKLFQLINDDGVSLPFPLGNVLGGGKHAGNGSPDIQEFLVSSIGAKDVFTAITTNLAVHREVRRLIVKRDPSFAGGKGDEGAWAPNMVDEQALDLVRNAVDNVSKELGMKIIMGIDVAASTFYANGIYDYSRKGKKLDKDGQLAYIEGIIKKYDLKFVEDPFDENDYDSFANLRQSLPNIMMIGDDIFVTDVNRVRKGIERGAGNGAILKVNQTGTLYDSLLFAKMCENNKFYVITSHRSGDVWEGYLAHIAVGTKSVMMKSGVVGGERMVKLIELYRISLLDKSFKMANLRV